jgi:hypothetical protein
MEILSRHADIVFHLGSMGILSVHLAGQSRPMLALTALLVVVTAAFFPALAFSTETTPLKVVAAVLGSGPIKVLAWPASCDSRLPKGSRDESGSVLANGRAVFED